MADEEAPAYSLTLEDGTVVHTSREFTGCGRAVYANGEVYDGDFDEGVRHGKGTYWYRNGDVYTGQFQENEKHGMGRLVYTGRKVANDEEDGEGDEGKKRRNSNPYHSFLTSYCTGGTSAQGGTYHGQFKEGEKHGQGTYKYNNGDVYSGDWAKGRKHGRGTYVYEDGSSLEGKWKEGSLMAGTWTLPSGVRFLGNFKENKPFGEGNWEMPCREGHTVSGKYVHSRAPTEEGQEAVDGNLSLRFIPHDM
ncbi:MORN repeat-containing protein, putative [Perkinsus marinus ATCC 50983]|uniref:MORN repeat-containing protein, putative n=1 Tax=Perkinsus marinus (strain ATCC 50983 / TXsc) TaxID=423536 RepID=C5KQR6_PERM5|nr:MORN repeat-containing protein, putative [Perkinsus marinus ATCC 50983]EER13162.1 MORN repeat-containing protein, putative [Perkinsus marinus ATCC 50983]|eukprot:XP_002781367.1 MORN repeat-containing protein, putative [Perkinsus marinus ATCC 50983]